MKRSVPGFGILALSCALLATPEVQGADKDPALARQAQGVLRKYCHRCHGKDGAIEGGLNYLLDRDKMVARRKIVLGKPQQSSIYRRMVAGKMPPKGEMPRPGAEEQAIIKRWIEAGAPQIGPTTPPKLVSEETTLDWILADLDKQPQGARRFTRYFTLAPLANAGHGPDELQTYRKALSKLLNSLSWSPRISIPQPIDTRGLVLRIDLRHYQWDATLWNRLLAEYPYGVIHDSAVARAVLVGTATRIPCVSADWFIATASRAPLYYELLQIPANSAELERQLRVDVSLNLQQRRAARAGFLGSGISRNNRVIERHEALTGSYWRTYDFEAIPQNLTDRDLLLPDRRNVFAYPLGPGGSDTTFQHAGGEIIFNLPNGLQGYMLVNADNQRINKGPTAIVSDPKRPDRAVEAGVSCMNCHARGIIPKDDQIRAHVAKNPRAFSRKNPKLIRGLYVASRKMRSLMEEDADRFRKAIEKTGNQTDAAEVVMAVTLRYEADVDLPTLAAAAGVSPEDLRRQLSRSGPLARHLAPLKVPGATVSRDVVVQAFGDIVRTFRLGQVFQPGDLGENLPDLTGEVDPLEVQSRPANAMAFHTNGRLAAFASSDRTVRLWDVEVGRELRRCIGHTASVWSVAFRPDGRQILSGGMDGTVRLWDVATGEEVRAFEGHDDLVSCVRFHPEGALAVSAGYDQQVLLWNVKTGKRVSTFSYPGTGRYINAAVFSPDGKQILLCVDNTLQLLDARSGKIMRELKGHTRFVTTGVFTPDGKHVLSGSDDRTLRLWDGKTGKQLRVFTGHTGAVRSVAVRADGQQALSGSADTTVRLWDLSSGKELRVFDKHNDTVVAVRFSPDATESSSGDHDARILTWRLGKKPIPVRVTPPTRPKAAATGKLRHRANLPVGGTISALHLLADQKALCYLNATEGTLGRINTQSLRRDGLLTLPSGTNTLRPTPDGKWLVALAPGESGSVLQRIDPRQMKPATNQRLTFTAYDIAANDAGWIFASGAQGGWTRVALIQASTGKVVGRWGGVWSQSFLRLGADQRKLYVSSQGVSPATLDVFQLPSKLTATKPRMIRAPRPEAARLGGEILATTDGQFLLFKTGTVLRASDLKLHTKLKPFLAATALPEKGMLLLIDRGGLLKRYSYPDLELQRSYHLGFAAYQLVCDSHSRLYVAGFDPRAVGARPRARGHGEIRVYALEDLK